MALVTTYRVGESLMIGDAIEVRIVAVRGNRVTLLIEAPRDLMVYRQRQLPLADPKPEDRQEGQP